MVRNEKDDENAVYGNRWSKMVFLTDLVEAEALEEFKTAKVIFPHN